jgi:hypothetical protein
MNLIGGSVRSKPTGGTSVIVSKAHADPVAIDYDTLGCNRL